MKTTYTRFGHEKERADRWMPAQKDLPDTVPREGTGHHARGTDAGKRKI